MKHYKEKEVERNQQQEMLEMELSAAKSKMKNLKQELTATRCNSKKLQPGQMEKMLEQMTHENRKQQEELKAADC